MEHTAKLSWTVRVACILIWADPDLLVFAPLRDQRRVVAEALLLALVAGMTGVMWFAFLGQFYDVRIAVAGGAFAATFIFLIDMFMGSAFWALSGILRQPGLHRGRDWLAGVALRVLISLIASMATSTGATMAMFHNAIATQLDDDRRTGNDAINEKYQKRTQALKARYFGTSLDDIETQRKSIAELGKQLDRAREQRAAAETQRQTYSAEADRELRGAPGYKAGAGPKYKDALDRTQTAEAEVAKADADIQAYEPRLAAAQKQLEASTAAVGTAQTDFKREAEKLDRERTKELIPERTDGLMAYIALTEVFVSPRFGPAAQHFAWLIMAVLMSVELAYLLVRKWFTPASIYTALLISDTRLQAEGLAVAYAKKSEELRRIVPHIEHTRAPLRFLRHESPPDAAD